MKSRRHRFFKSTSGKGRGSPVASHKKRGNSFVADAAGRLALRNIGPLLLQTQKKGGSILRRGGKKEEKHLRFFIIR